MVALMRWMLAAALLPAGRIPVILDTDIGTDIDDALALALALSSPEIELRGVTTVSADAYTRALIACRFLERTGHGAIPVAAGRPRREKPQTKEQYSYGLEGDFRKRPVPELAVEFLYQRLKAEPGRLTLVTIGDLTNAANLLAAHPEAKPWIRQIVLMGGAVRVGYNGRPPASWEWNIHSDIQSAKAVFSSGVPLVVAPLDATTTVKLEAPLRERIFGSGLPLGRELAALYKLWGRPTPTLFDPVAVTLVFNRSFCGMEKLRLEVDGGGVTREAAGPANADVALTIRREEFLNWYTGRIAGTAGAVENPEGVLFRPGPSRRVGYTGVIRIPHVTP